MNDRSYRYFRTVTSAFNGSLIRAAIEIRRGEGGEEGWLGRKAEGGGRVEGGDQPPSLSVLTHLGQCPMVLPNGFIGWSPARKLYKTRQPFQENEY